MANSVVINILAKVGGLSEVEKFKSKLTSLSTSKGFQNAVMGVGMGVGISAWNGLANALSNIPDMIMSVSRAAAEDEQSQARLYQSIQANAKAWDGNKAAIEDVITARMKLAFSDSEQRDSLALLVAKTGDVTEALRIQRVAMDLARLKGIDLATASRAIAMGMEGSGRALKELGINVAEVTDKTEVLTMVQEKAAGQAEAYGDTASGTFESLQIVMEELAESIGYILLPYMKDLARTLRDDVVPNVEALAVGLDWVGKIIDPVGAAMGDAKEKMRGLEEEAQRLKFEKLAEGAAAWDTFAEKGAAAREVMRDAGSAARGAAAGVGAVSVSASEGAANLNAFRKSFADVARGMRDNALTTAFDAKRLPHEITLAKAEVVAAQKDLEKARTGEQKAEANIRLLDAQQSLEELSNKSRDFTADYGLTGKALGDALGGTLYARIVIWTGRVQAILNSIRAPGSVPKAAGPLPVPRLPGTGAVRRGAGRASGGPVEAGGLYVVGERGPELFAPRTAGQIIPNGGGVSVVVPVYLTSTISARDVERASALRARYTVRKSA